MYKSGISHMLTFLVSLVVGHAIMVLLRSYVPHIYSFFLRLGQSIAYLFNISYNQKIMGTFIIATLLSFFIGLLFHKLLKTS